MNRNLNLGSALMVRWNRVAVVALLACAALSVQAQTTAPAENGEMDPTAREALKMLQDRRGTLKDFQANVVYDVLHSKTEDREGKLGRVDYLMDPMVGPTFTVRFDKDTSEGVPIKNHKQDLLFDGTNVTIVDHVGKTFTRRRVLEPGAKPGDATSLNGGMPLPIGVDVEEIAKDFEVTVLPAAEGANADQVTLKLVPKGDAVKRFDFKSLVMTVDKKLQLPVKVVRTERNSDVTTVELKDAELNTGKAKMADTSVPTGGDWTIDLGDK